jgi:hypothetical protein
MKPVIVCESGQLLFFGVHILECSHVMTKSVDSLSQSRNVDYNVDGVNIRQCSSHFANLFENHVMRGSKMKEGDRQK